MRKAFVLGPVLVLAALMSGCGGGNQLIVVRDIPAGDVIQETDLQTWQSGVEPFRPESWGWAEVNDRPKVIGRKAKNMIGTGSHFHKSEIEP